MDLLVTKIKERSRSTTARNRFMYADQATAKRHMDYQSTMCLDQIATVNEYPWIYTNASVLAEACAHWAFIARPDLRIDDNFWESL